MSESGRTRVRMKAAVAGAPLGAGVVVSEAAAPEPEAGSEALLKRGSTTRMHTRVTATTATTTATTVSCPTPRHPTPVKPATAAVGLPTPPIQPSHLPSARPGQLPPASVR